MSGGHFNGLVSGGVTNVTRVFDQDRLALAERRAAQLIDRIQPNSLSEERRTAVTSYVRRLITSCISCKVCTFGSVPLKTYLPDGDIDLTALSNDNEMKEIWANKVRYALECEEKNENAEFRVKEVQYIQAEVKIIKCLVENIVVDISFNQVGGICTLCFLGEIDRLINNNYLFKRSIILIKAWCYYESRILGAHHGLISTYALETLVLYIFHIFNNKFTGPLEVLYRFLEFFSIYDWEKYCLSLWGPVPISSLPHMIVEPPRRDDGNLLLNKPFLDWCVVRYVVHPGGQETPGQPFSSKHFNVIDPLRINNNLGRSVSKGNFFRIRSAFAFGAKRLATLLECRKEDLVTELNQFFRNTWERHGSGVRPDAPVPALHSLQPPENVSAEEPRQHRSTDYNNKKKSHGHAVIHTSSEKEAETLRDNRTSNPKFPRSQTQKARVVQPVFRDQSERNYTTSTSTGVNNRPRDQKTPKPQYTLNSNSGLARFQFVRTRSSPELTDSSVESFPRTRRGRALDNGKATRSENGSVRRSNANPGSEISGTHSTKSSLDDFPRSFNCSSPHPSLEGGASDTHSMSNSYENGFASISEELASVAETLEGQQEMSQEDQDLVNLVGIRGLNGGQIQLPQHMASSNHLPLAYSPLLASGAQAQGNWAGVLPANLANLSLINTPWSPNLQFHPGFVSPPLAPYSQSPFVPNPDETAGPNLDVTVTSNHAEKIVLPHDSTGPGVQPGEEQGTGWRENNPVARPPATNRDSTGGSSFVPITHGINPQHSVPVQPRIGREDLGTIEEGASNEHQNHMGRLTDVSISEARVSNTRQSSWQESQSRGRPLYDGSRNRMTERFPRSPKDRWERKPTSLSGPAAPYGKGKPVWQPEITPESFPEADNETNDWASTSAGEESGTDRIPHMSYDPAVLTNGSAPNSVFPIGGPVLLGSSSQRIMDNHGGVFIQTGPPIFYMVPPQMLHEMNNHAAPSLSDREEVASQADRDCDSGYNSDMVESHNHIRPSPTPSTAASVTDSEERNKSDILNSDLNSHLENLNYGRFCQNAPCQVPWIAPSPIMVPQILLQGHFPSEGARPVAGNFNMTQVMGYGPRLIPIMPFQSGPERVPGATQRFGEEAPRSRGGTGTFLPSPGYRERPASTRNQRWNNHNNDRTTEHSDREGSWITAKQRAAAARRASSRADRHHHHQLPTDHQSESQWQTYRHDSYRQDEQPATTSSYAVLENNPVGGASAPPHRPGNAGYSMYLAPQMMSSYEQGGAGYNRSAEPVEFGSIRQNMPLHDEVILPREQRSGGSSRSTPEPPLSPQSRR